MEGSKKNTKQLLERAKVELPASSYRKVHRMNKGRIRFQNERARPCNSYILHKGPPQPVSRGNQSRVVSQCGNEPFLGKETGSLLRKVFNSHLVNCCSLGGPPGAQKTEAGSIFKFSRFAL